MTDYNALNGHSSLLSRSSGRVISGVSGAGGKLII